MPRLTLTFSALAVFAGLGIFACAQDGADLGAGSDPTTDLDSGSIDSVAPPPSTTPDTGAQERDSAPPPQDSGVPPEDSAIADATPPPNPDAAPLPNGDCDVSNIVTAGYYSYQYLHASTQPPPCPCSAGYCCYNVAPFPPGCVK